MPKPILENPFATSAGSLPKPAVKKQIDVADLPEWMIDNPMLNTRNYSVHLQHTVADRLDEVLADLTSRPPVDGWAELNVSRIVEIAVSYLLDNFAREEKNSELLRQLNGDKKRRS